VNLLNPRPNHPPADFFLSICFSKSPGVSSQKGVQKHHKNIFAKSPCRKQFPTKPTKISMSVFGFIAVSSASQRREFKNTTKHILQTNRVLDTVQSKVFTNKTGGKPNPIFSRIAFITFLGRFTARGDSVQKHHQKNIGKRIWPWALGPGPFLASGL
jgi:hypothetical protein